MIQLGHIASVIGLVTGAFLINIPLGYAREKSKKYSLKWFVLIHLSIPFMIAARLFLHVEFKYVPFIIIGAICGQFSSKVGDKLFKFFSSVKLAAVLIAVIAFTSIIGTIIEQNGDPQNNLKLIERIFGISSAPNIYSIFYSLGFMDMYHSIWFIAILVLFCLNLIICSLDRLPRISKIVNEPLSPLKSGAASKFSIHKELNLKGNIENYRGKIEIFFKKLGFYPIEAASDIETQFYAQKGAFTRYGIYVTHLSIIIILIGSVIGVFFGFDGFLNLPEGEVSDVAFHKNGSGEQKLGFSIRCDDFNVEFYKDTDRPMRYISWLTILKYNKEVKKQVIEVNTPLKYEGYTFYQANYGPMPPGKGVIVLRVTPNGEAEEILKLKVGESFNLAGTNLTATVVQFAPALAFDKDWKPFNYTEMMNNPAVFVVFKEKEETKLSWWVQKRYNKTWEIPGGHKIELIDNWGGQYTGLQVRKDPGVWLVYLGFMLMVIGLFFAMFTSHKKMWVIMSSEKGRVIINIAASANKNRTAFEEKIDNLSKLLS
ncbi:MAG: cytochrome c biogenesis protein ResB [Nitrospirae bacterium]|nr:cytochrome c biogenesis protein ResB [Nitrospirota bacterium]MBF0539945.1 cytochrome c biogenesis protein ResB [Nitrospirota bacterium]